MKNLFKQNSLFVALLILILIGCQNNQEDTEKMPNELGFTSPLGKELFTPEPSEKNLKLMAEAKQNFANIPDNPDNVIWLGRRTAYLGKYTEAINIFTKGIETFPEDARFYRHRGHRYISIRKYDMAIADFTTAVKLIEGQENEIEPDGMPNAMNIPITTLHGNIYYHLGLAYYLKHEYQDAYKTFIKCRETGSNADNIVSSTHWLYMIQRRMENMEQAELELAPIEADMTIIENTSYYNLCKLYKGLISVDSLMLDGNDIPASDAVKYGLANWYFYNGDKDKAREVLDAILTGDSWTSFGYIAAESDMIMYYSQ